MRRRPIPSLLLACLAISSPLPGEEPAETAPPKRDTTAAEVAAGFGRLLAVALGNASEDILLDGNDWGDDGEELSPLIGSPAPHFEATTAEGETWSLSDHQGKIVVIDLWASWCGPCVRLMPQINKLHEESADDVVVVGINSGEAEEDVLAFLEKRDFSMTHLIDEPDAISTLLGCESLPMTVVIDAKGVVQQIHNGFEFTLGDQLAEAIDRLRRGENLYDEDLVRLAREERATQYAANVKRLGPVEPERLNETAFLPLDGGAYFDGLGPSRRLSLGQDRPATLAVDLGSSIALFTAGEAQPRIVTLDWGAAGGDLVVSAVEPIATDEGIQFAAFAEETEDYDEESDEQATELSLRFGLFDADGERVWDAALPILGDWGAGDIAAADLDGDGSPEIVALTEHYGRYREDGPEDYFHVLSVYSRGGELKSRRWFEGLDGVGVYVLDHPNGPRVMVNRRGGAVLYTYLPDDD